MIFKFSQFEILLFNQLDSTLTFNIQLTFLSCVTLIVLIFMQQEIVIIISKKNHRGSDLKIPT